MLTMIIVSLFCFILYRTGKAAAMLEAFRLSPTPKPAQPEPLTASEDPEELQEPQTELETLDRLQLENDALQVLKNKGVNNANIYIKMYSIGDLLDIIKNN